MSKFTKEMVDDYANKLLIGLTDEENKMVLDEFGLIEKQMEIIANIPNIENVDAMTYALDDFCYELRDDEKISEVETDKLLANCDCVEDNLVSVPKVWDND